tara:strand:- start:165 stop:422 length:258 start_codon:yes stop_codon:yes gene_type:complete
MVQKIVNVIAIASGAVSAAVIASGLFVYVNRDSIIDNIKREAIEAVGGSLGGGALTGDVGLPISTQPDAAPSAPVPSGGLGVPTF